MINNNLENNIGIVKFSLIGFGNAARRLAELLIEKEQEIAQKYQTHFICTAIATARHGVITSDKEINLTLALDKVKSNQSLTTLDGVITLADSFQAISKSSADIMIETSILSLENGEPALSHIKQALLARQDVVTANKGPLAFAASELLNLAKTQDRYLYYESTMMDGTPVFNLVRHTLPLAKIHRIKGIVNSTTNFILSEMEEGKAFANALAKAQNVGIAEADPSLDVDGWDAAVKACVLANCLMDAKLKPKDVNRLGIANISLDEISTAQKAGKKIRLVMDIINNNGKISASVLPTEIDTSDVFYTIDAFSNVLTLETDLMGTLIIIEKDPTLTQTAYGLFSDLLSIISARKGTNETNSIT